MKYYDSAITRQQLQLQQITRQFIETCNNKHLSQNNNAE